MGHPPKSSIPPRIAVTRGISDFLDVVIAFSDLGILRVQDTHVTSTNWMILRGPDKDNGFGTLNLTI
jgi:hypothetical protein